MRDENSIVRDRQLAIRREMDRRDISIKAVALDGGWKDPSTVLSYFPNPEGAKEPATMSVAALYRLIKTGALPIDLLSLLLPEGHLIVKAPVEIDHDTLSEVVQDYIREKERAHHPESENGRDIGPNENNILCIKAATLRAVVG